MICGGRCAQGCHGVRNSVLRQTGHVQITLYDQDPGQRRPGLAGFVQPVEGLALVKGDRFRGIEVFRFALI